MPRVVQTRTRNLNSPRKDILRLRRSHWGVSPRLLADSGSHGRALRPGSSGVTGFGPELRPQRGGSQRESGPWLCPLSQPERSETNAQDKNGFEIAFRALRRVNFLSELTPKACRCFAVRVRHQLGSASS